MSDVDLLDLTIGVLGTQVPQRSPTIKWRDGHITVLPAIYNGSTINICDEVDIPFIKFISQCPQSKAGSTHVSHMRNEDLSAPNILDTIADTLALNMCVLITGVPHKSPGRIITDEYLDVQFGISPLRPLCIHDAQKRCHDHVNPTIQGNIHSFMKSMFDPTKIQCILDIPLAQISMPEALRNLDHGLVHGWNQTTNCVPIRSHVHPDNFTAKGWALLHHAGFVTYPHHDAEGTLTWVRMEAGIKFWAIFSLRDGANNRIGLQDLSVKLADYARHKTWIHKNCDAEVLTLRPGDMLILPPGVVHAVYTPVPSFSTGGHFYHYSCMHLTELARYIDAEVGESTTNQAMDHALETLRRMVIMLPYLSRRVVLPRRALLSLCLMACKGRQYRAAGSNASSVEDTETAPPCFHIVQVVYEFLGITQRIRAGDILYTGDQLHPGIEVDRMELLRSFKDNLDL
ncbi:uncharacterized protein F5147DRAFT_783481 [Suillus discolor]|uniref:JmjC domain-containing protein n=1 Tax=Suillus discolor TaxID=1912936 RepID=A0A9P7ER26_9AGAM|nr:uncharacterized protein F5147DRAFT_783481 [Suillus discolor]KAG2081945.1 hypothetical protein F5147DRAFT_783481 [Suillus discolor]